jgi:hypothetical protein
MVSTRPRDDVSARTGTVLDSGADRPMSGSLPEGVHDVLAVPRIIAPTLLLPGEIVIFELKPSMWYVVFTSLPILTVGLLVVYLASAIRELPDSLRHLGVILGVSVLGLRVAVALMDWLGRTYVLTDRRVLKQCGVVDVQVQSMNLEDVANVFVAQAAAQKALGIGTLFFRPIATGVPLAWEHIRHPGEVHARVATQIERWKHTLAMTKPK